MQFRKVTSQVITIFLSRNAALGRPKNQPRKCAKRSTRVGEREGARRRRIHQVRGPLSKNPLINRYGFHHLEFVRNILVVRRVFRVTSFDVCWAVCVRRLAKNVSPTAVARQWSVPRLSVSVRRRVRRKATSKTLPVPCPPRVSSTSISSHFVCLLL